MYHNNPDERTASVRQVEQSRAGFSITITVWVRVPHEDLDRTRTSEQSLEGILVLFFHMGWVLMRAAPFRFFIPSSSGG